MKLQVKRFSFQDKCTIGHLFIDGTDTGLFTLEDKVRELPGINVAEWKVPAETAIPKGIYKVIITFSDHFQKFLPLLVDVPGFDGVRIHPGNIDSDTEGCVLVGKIWRDGDWIGQSQDAFNWLFPQIKAADSVTIEVG
jgi:hypothetical protein